MVEVIKRKLNEQIKMPFLVFVAINRGERGVTPQKSISARECREIDEAKNAEWGSSAAEVRIV